MAIEEEPFELGDLRHDADGVGEALAVGQNGADRAPGKLAVADLAPARRADASRFADRVGREVVVQHEGFFVGALERIDVLLVFARAERGDGERLGLAPGEERAAVGAGQNADLAHDGPHRDEIAPVDARLAVEDARADDFLLGLLEGGRDLGRLCTVVIGGNERGNDLVLDGGNTVAAFLLAGDRIGRAELAFADLADARDHLAVVLRLELPGLFRRAFGELDDGVDQGLEVLLPVHDRAEHHLFGKFLGLGFDHQHRVGGAGHDEIERALRHFVDHRVEHILAADIADAGGPDRPEEGDAGERQRGGACYHRDDIGVVLHVVGEDGCDDLRLVLEARREERADRPVDQARGQGFLLGRAPFALEIAARDLARGEGLFLVVHGQRKEVDAGPLFLHGNDGGENASLAIGREHGAIGLTGDAAGLKS